MRLMGPRLRAWSRYGSIASRAKPAAYLGRGVRYSFPSCKDSYRVEDESRR